MSNLKTSLVRNFDWFWKLGVISKERDWVWSQILGLEDEVCWTNVKQKLVYQRPAPSHHGYICNPVNTVTDMHGLTMGPSSILSRLMLCSIYEFFLDIFRWINLYTNNVSTSDEIIKSLMKCIDLLRLNIFQKNLGITKTN